MRENIRSITGDDEFDALYDPTHSETGEEADISKASTEFGSSTNEEDEQRLKVHRVSHCNPLMVLFWLQTVVRRLCVESRNGESPKWAIGAPNESQLQGMIQKVEEHFCHMDQIDKHYFPFPYAQLLDLVLNLFLLSVAFCLEPKTGRFNAFFVGLIAIGFFGLDEVAEILESPFGDDPNHINIYDEAQGLVEDISDMLTQRDMEFAAVFSDEHEINFSTLQLLTRYDNSDMQRTGTARITRSGNNTDIASPRGRKKRQDATVALDANQTHQREQEPAQEEAVEAPSVIIEVEPEAPSEAVGVAGIKTE